MDCLKINSYLLLTILCLIQIIPFIFYNNQVSLIILQYIGGIILIPGYMVQIYKLIKAKSSKNLSIIYGFTLCIGIGLMEVYAINSVLCNKIKDLLPFLLTNTCSFILCIIFQFLIIYFK